MTETAPEPQRFSWKTAARSGLYVGGTIASAMAALAIINNTVFTFDFGILPALIEAYKSAIAPVFEFIGNVFSIQFSEEERLWSSMAVLFFGMVFARGGPAAALLVTVLVITVLVITVFVILAIILQFELDQYINDPYKQSVIIFPIQMLFVIYTSVVLTQFFLERFLNEKITRLERFHIITARLSVEVLFALLAIIGLGGVL